MRRVVLGFSGGVDSSVAAALLREAGWEVLCLYLETGSGEEAAARAAADAWACRWRYTTPDAELEKHVCAPFAAAYARGGRRPSPCVMCNPSVKLRLLLEYAAGRARRPSPPGTTPARRAARSIWAASPTTRATCSAASCRSSGGGCCCRWAGMKSAEVRAAGRRARPAQRAKRRQHGALLRAGRRLRRLDRAARRRAGAGAAHLRRPGGRRAPGHTPLHAGAAARAGLRRRQAGVRLRHRPAAQQHHPRGRRRAL